MLLEVRAWLDAPDPDHATKWYKRRKAEEHSKPLTESTSAAFDQLNPASWGESLKSMFGFGAKKTPQQPTLLRELGGILANDALKESKSPEEAAHLMWMLAVTGVGALVTAIAEVLEFYLSPNKGSKYWPQIVKLTQQDTPAADTKLERYFLEAQRLTSAQLVKHVSNGKDILLDIGAAGKDPKIFPNPSEFSLDANTRKLENYIIHGFGPRGRLGKDMLLAYGTALLKVAAKTKGIRMAPGKMGELKQVHIGKERRRHYLTADWAYVVDEPTTWKLHFDELP